MEDTEAVTFSDPKLIGVEQTEDDWRLVTYYPFKTEETLTVTFTDGTELTVTVTDDYQPVTASGLYRSNGTETWSKNDKLTGGVKNQYAYFYHSNVQTTFANITTYNFQNDALNSGTTYDTVEFRNAFHFPSRSNSQHAYNVCVKVHLNNVPSGRTLTWASPSERESRIFLNNDGGSPYLSVGLIGASGTQSTLPMYDISWEMWLEDPDTHEKVDWIPLMGGSCFVGDEYVTVYSTENIAYTNFPVNVTAAQLDYSDTYQGWWHAANNYDDPDYYLLGVADTDGIVKGRYVTEWSISNFACELTANLYEIPLSVTKVVQGSNSNVPATTSYLFRAGYYDPFVEGRPYVPLAGHAYTIVNVSTGSTVSTGTLPASGEFSLRNGQRINIDDIEVYNTNARIDEYTKAVPGGHTAAYFDYLHSTTATLKGADAALTTDNTIGAKSLEFMLANTESPVVYTNTLGERIEAVELKVTKILPGSTSTREFEFTATAEDGEFIAGEGYTIDQNGQAVFNLRNAESVSLQVTEGATVTLSETNYQGYSVSFSGADNYHKDGASDSFLMDGDREITVTNRPGAALPTTGGRGVVPLYVCGTLLIMAVVLITIERKRGRTDGMR